MISIFKNGFFKGGLYCLLIFLSACYEPQEGCLDPEAENYLVSVDDPCCCDYPDRGIQLDMRWDTLNFRMNRDYENNFGDTFRITALRYAASGLKWYYGGETVRVEEILEGKDPISGAPVRYHDDWIILEAGKETFFAGTVRRHGAVDSFAMELGWGTEDPSDFMITPPNSHPLDTATSPLFNGSDKTWSALRMTVIYGNGSRDTTAITVSGLNVPLQLNTSFFQALGKDHTVTLTVSVDQWLRDVDWRADIAMIRERIVAGMADSHVLSAE